MLTQSHIVKGGQTLVLPSKIQSRKARLVEKDSRVSLIGDEMLAHQLVIWGVYEEKSAS